MRAFAAEGNLKEFAKGIPGGNEKMANDLMNAVRKGMGVREEEESVTELWQIAPKLDQEGLREAYITKEVFALGALVEHLDTGVQGTVVYRGTNYAIFEDQHGWRFRCWLQHLHEVVENEKHHSADDGSGNDWKVGTDTYRQAVQAMTPGQSLKKFSDFRKSK
jgi:hypothetical protein